MRIIISPAKKMNVDTDSFPCQGLPVFLPRAEELCGLLQSKTREELKSLWQCSDRITEQNLERLGSMDLRRGLTPAILAYEGIQYRYMSPGVFTEQALDYVQEHLRILSGFYGVLRPFDGVTPYRLEMQAKLQAGESGDLYEYWGDSIAKVLFAETDSILNLASKEYSLCVSRYLPEHVRFLTCVFGEEKDGKIIEKGTLCKMARGEMVRWMAENQVTDIDRLRDFDRLDYHFDPARSEDGRFVFVRNQNGG